MMLENKNAVIYGAAGSLGEAVSRAFVKAGATVFLSGRNLGPVQQLADDIVSSGGKAEAMAVDALNEREVRSFMDTVVQKAGTIDISFNAIALQDKQSIPLIEMRVEDFTRPVNLAMQTHFLTSTAAGRAMKKQGSGVILTLTATPAGIGYPMVGGFGPACSAMESFMQNLASELGPNGVRVVNIRSGGSPDSRVFREALAGESEESRAFLKKMEDDTMLKKLPMMEDIANLAVFLTSEMAGKITGVTIDITCGTTSALNYKVPNIPFTQK